MSSLPIVMTATAMLMAAFIVKSLPLDALKWVVLGVVVYTSAMMFLSAHRSQQENPDSG